MPHLVAAMDKFRGTASAPEACAAVVGAARDAGWSADGIPMSDGGEGLLEVLGGSPCVTAVPGPLGDPVEAEWRLLPVTDGAPPTAVIEMSTAAGRALLTHPTGDDPVRADTTGVGRLLLAARETGARRIVIGCGGSATTDGGWGALREAGSRSDWSGIDLVVACDVTTPFREAAAVFGPQKGATPEQVMVLAQRLDDLAERYRREFGVDVDTVPGAGAAGGLAGGLLALGARIEPGFDLVADMNRVADRMGPADLVVTGEGHLDPPSFQGKVPGGLLALAHGRPVLCLVGDADPDLLARPPDGMEIISLTDRFGAERARSATCVLLSDLMTEVLTRT